MDSGWGSVQSLTSRQGVYKQALVSSHTGGERVPVHANRVCKLLAAVAVRVRGHKGFLLPPPYYKEELCQRS